MSISVMTAIWRTCLFQGNTLNVLLAMADFADDDGGDIFPGIDLLAAKCRATGRTVQNSLRELEDTGAIQQITNGLGGKGRATEYRIDLERVKNLHRLHEAENPDCEHCQARRRSAEKRAAYRAERVKKSPPKGENPAPKGENSAAKGENSGSRIDNNHQEPSNNHQHSQRAGEADAQSDGNVASLGKEDLERWPEFRTAIADTWPGGMPQDNDEAAKAAFGRATRIAPAQQLIDCARKHGDQLRERAKHRPPSAGKVFVKLPSNWLKAGDWKGYAQKIHEAATAEATITTKLGNVLRDVGKEWFDYFRHTLEMPDTVIATLDGIVIETDPPAIIVRTGVGRMMLEKHFFKLCRKLGDDLQIRLISPVTKQGA
jgi:hypothetical protein